MFRKDIFYENENMKTLFREEGLVRLYNIDVITPLFFRFQKWISRILR